MKYYIARKVNKVLLHAVVYEYQHNVEQKPNTKRAHTGWMYLIKVQKQEKGIPDVRSWDSGYPRGQSTKDHQIYATIYH